ncbi:hypothetical protein FC89_GL000944 [Liquorilactobacillus ghanensis DSM 18630]|uniref:HTH lacI-type domain-containing protein n=1 Tax=Liquorilactobacillus ghanensis DSM 18630 TaxID=1423750 RepID=A0A0R1VL91_9LACO|nr:LacI family DNA-binding transcriptional regulator [Liquorilactobacillus ghanensis]KRM06077.1 hypothetical protein FC89_GL000944 [Liquorilactobacillus ghanensis DSM 18630]
MVTLKDVAKAAGVSPSTASIVANGRAKERNISTTTYNKVMSAINKLGYVQNLNARNLRYANSTIPRIAIFWPLDQRSNILSTFLSAIKNTLKDQQQNYSIIIQTYTAGDILKDDALWQSYSAIIVSGASHDDVLRLEHLSKNENIILVNRHSDILNTIQVSSEAIANNVIDLLLAERISRIAVFKSNNNYPASSQRIKLIQSACAKHNINVEQLISVADSLNGGIQGINELLAISNHPTTIIFETDSIALGANYAIKQHHLSVPKDIQLLSISSLDPELTKFSNPPITSVEVSTKLLSLGLAQILEKFLNNQQANQHLFIKPKINLRGSLKNESHQA